MPSQHHPIKPASELLRHTIGFRMNDAEYVEFLKFLETFPHESMSLAMRWLMEQPATKETIRQHIVGTLI